MTTLCTACLPVLVGQSWGLCCSFHPIILFWCSDSLKLGSHTCNFSYSEAEVGGFLVQGLLGSEQVQGLVWRGPKMELSGKPLPGIQFSLQWQICRNKAHSTAYFDSERKHSPTWNLRGRIVIRVGQTQKQTINDTVVQACIMTSILMWGDIGLLCEVHLSASAMVLERVS